MTPKTLTLTPNEAFAIIYGVHGTIADWLDNRCTKEMKDSAMSVLNKLNNILDEWIEEQKNEAYSRESC